MRRQLALIAFALGSARRRAERNLSILLALILVTFAFSSVLFLTEALRAEFRIGAEVLPDLIVQRLVAGRPGLIAEENAEFMRDIPGVIAVEPRIWGYYFIPALAGNLTIVGMDPKVHGSTNDLSIVVDPGRLPDVGAPGEIVLGESLAAFLGLGVDDKIGIPVGSSEMALKVVGVFHSPVALWTADVILMRRADARRFLQVPAGYATDIAVRLSTPDEAVVVATKIAERLPEARIVDRQLMDRTYDLTFDTRGGIMAAMLMPALIAFLTLAWDRLSGVGPGERREIGVLKAIGWKTGDVIAARMWENCLLSFFGATLGMLVAYVYVFHARAPGLSSVLFGWSSIYPPLRLAPAVDLAQVFVLTCLVVIPFVAASAVPAWRTATRDPQKLLRGLT